jgi:uncharacterized protein YbjT (DUF2867 family)
MKVLITGANGYIGRRLKRRMLGEPPVAVRLMVRSARSVSVPKGSNLEAVEGNTFDPASLDRALEGVDVAYYLIHSMASGENYRELDRKSAENFREAAIRQGVGRIVYLGGLGVKESASEHLLSRIETGEILSARPDAVQCLWFRAGVIIGSGSASFEIIRNLVQKLPVMVTPEWVQTRAQPIGVHDVVRYLDGAKDLVTKESLVIDIGAEEMSYREMMEKTAEAMGLKRRLIPVPFFTPGLSSYWLGLFTPVPVSIARALIEGLRSEAVRQNRIADDLFAFRPAPFESAVRAAVDEIEQQQVISRWSDSGGEVWERDHGKDIANALFVDRRELELGTVTPKRLFAAISCIGGERGWFSYSFLWQLRGLADKLLGGAGLNRGRRCETALRIGDTVDFWKVVDLVPEKRLLLFAQMKLPGRAWLEFRIDGGRLVQSAYYYPDGLAGRLYWYAMLPFHYFIFRDMAKSLMERASQEA